MSTGRVVPQPSFSLPHATPFQGASFPLTPPDSPSSDDENKHGREEEVPSCSLVRKTSESSSGSEADEDEGKEAAATEAAGVLIACAELCRAWEGAAAGPPSEGLERERGKGSSRSEGSAGTEWGHAACEGDSGYDAAVCVMQQKAGAPPLMTALSDPSQPASLGCPPLRSVLKRSGQRSRGHHVTINEARNEVVEADYVILLRDEDEPQLVSIRTFDLGLNSNAVDQVTLSPPDGYKDVFGHAIHETIDDSGKSEYSFSAIH